MKMCFLDRYNNYAEAMVKDFPGWDPVLPSSQIRRGDVFVNYSGNAGCFHKPEDGDPVYPDNWGMTPGKYFSGSDARNWWIYRRKGPELGRRFVSNQREKKIPLP